MESSSNLDVVQGVLHDHVVLDDLYDIGAFRDSVKEIGSPLFPRKFNFQMEMILTDDDTSILQVLDDDDEMVFSEDASIFLCDVFD
ncbi:hypothetical protein L7F22_027855, partial [Adiantum nelumboides]|nr:hypothetical protein [Adiantum nelumboides]